MFHSWLYSVLYSIVVFLVFSLSPISAHSAEHETLFEVAFEDGSVVTDSLIAYERSGTWYFPLSFLTDAIGLDIKVSPRLKVAEGFILNESRHFKLNLNQCMVEYGSVKSNLPLKGSQCDDVLLFENDFYISQKYFETWFPLQFKIDLIRLKIIISSNEKLPYQLQKERELQAERILSSQSKFDPGYPKETLRNNWFEGPFVDTQSLFSNHLTRNDLTVGNELLGLDSITSLSFLDRKLGKWRLELGRKDTEGKLLGPLHAREVQLYDIGFPNLPLISNGKNIRGLLVSSYPLNALSLFGNQEFQGELLSGWEVELYHNELLIGRQVSDGTGRYSFKDVELNYGKNDFQLIFYGPQGQRKEEFQSYQIDSDLIRPQGRDFRLALGDLGHSNLYLAQIDQSITKHITARTGIARLNWLQNPNPKSYAYLGLSGFNKYFLISGLGAFNQENGKAWQLEMRMPFMKASLGAKYTQLYNFKSELFNPDEDLMKKEQISFNLNHILFSHPSMRLSWEITRNLFVDDSLITSLTQRTVTHLGRLLFNHDILYDLGNPSSVSGKFDLHFIPGFSVYRIGMSYGFGGIKVFDSEIQTKFSEKFSGTGGFKYFPGSNLKQASVSLSRQFKSFLLGCEGSGNSNAEYTVGLLLNMSLAWDPHQSELHIESETQARYGAASVQVFIDENYNGKYDPGEKVLSGIGLIVNQREEDLLTDENGGAYLNHLSPYVPTDIALSLRTIENPILEPSKNGVRIIPRPGKTNFVEFPVNAVGEIDGIIEISNGEIRKKDIPILLEKVQTQEKMKTVLTDHEGLFWINSIQVGEYFLSVDPDFLQKHRLSSTPSMRKIIIPKEGSFESGNGFVLKKY